MIIIAIADKPVMALDALDVDALVDVAVEHLADQVDAALAEGQVRHAQRVVEDLVCFGTSGDRFIHLRRRLWDAPLKGWAVIACSPEALA